ncbi:MAG: hypothetical protein JWM93_2529 [Frankiales bacterium]|nr:hypothetical protein [Frankiales bacterium]
MARTKRLSVVLLSAALAASAAVAVPAFAHDGGDNRGRGGHEGRDHNLLLRAAIVGSQLSDLPIAGSTRGGAPWVADDSTVRVTTDGHIVAHIRGLVIPSTTTAPSVNPVPALSASLVCSNVKVATTPTVPFSTAGDATIDTVIAVPARCLAPAVLIHPNANVNVYIAASTSPTVE